MRSELAERKVPTFDQAYARLRPLFFAALGNLARRGFVVSPTDSMDLVHDFFAEAWTDLERHFDPDKGSFESYAYGAFIRFARPRIVRLRRWQSCLIGAEELDAFPAKPPEDMDTSDQERVRYALAKLPEGEQGILRRYVYSDYASERALARELGVSRYRLREMLVDALGHLVVSFDRPTRIQPQDWGVALALWRDRRTVHEAAVVLQLTPQQIRSAYQRNCVFLAEVLRHYQPQTWSPERREKMATQPLSALVLLERALHSPQQSDLLKDVRAHAEEILQALEASDSPATEPNLDQLSPEQVSPEWVAEVYQAIFQGAGADLQPDVAAAQAAEAHEKEDTAIGKAFRDALLADLNEELRYPKEVRSLPKISLTEQQRLGRAPDVRAGTPESERWITHGIRPLTVFYATKSASGLLDRYLRRGVLPPGPILLGDESLVVHDEQSSYPLSGLLKEEISRRAECSPQIAGALYSWMLQVGQYKCWLFAGFEAAAQPGGQTLLLIRSAEKFEQTYQRWGLTSFRHQKAELEEYHTGLKKAMKAMKPPELKKLADKA